VNCVVLIGMPGAGKSTLGVMLAKNIALDFVDTDILIQNKLHCTLQYFLDENGYLALREEEEKVLLAAEYSHQVIATGGSAVYSEAGMARLKSLGPVVLLNVSEEELLRRIDDMDSRGIACAPGQSFHDLFVERQRLYQHYADIVIECDGKNQHTLAQELLVALQET